ncbi:MAG: UPF0182 family membrane protein [Dehalococcoidia bacterium]
MPRGSTRWLGALAIGFVFYTLASLAKSIYADWLWFQSLGYASVYSTEIVTKVWLFVAGAGLFLLLIAVNLVLARRLAPQGFEESFVTDLDPATLRRIVAIGLIAGSIFLAVIFGSTAAGEWATVLRFLHRVPFSASDPTFKRDVGFYTFTLPLLRFLQSWLLGTTVIILLGVAGLYGFVFSLQGFTVRFSRAIKAHVGALVILLLALFIAGYILSIFELNFSTSGTVFGATYTDLHARLPAYLILIVFAGLAAILVCVDVLRDGYVLAGAGIGVWLVALVLGLGIYPASVQRLSVQPNELNKERPYIQRNIDVTRAAYGLDKIEAQSYPADPGVSTQQIQANSDTIANIRLWDPRPLLDTYKQLQEIRPLYAFPDVSVDRYTIDGKYREVTLSPRELDQGKVPGNARSWINLKTFYTHGYGAVVSPVNEVSADGLPNLLLKDIPPEGIPSLTQSGIYYGLKTDPYVIVHTRNQEFDYPAASGDQLSTYNVDGGVQLNSFLRRLAYAWELGDTNILISNQITSQSRLLYRRNIQDRIGRIAPFLKLDKDPYLVISNGGLYWIQDAYTVTDHYPYSQPSSEGFNYIRNSVKVVVDAYSGKTAFYLVDPTDPIARTYASIFPKLFTPFSQMPSDLQTHLRYPQDLFEVQSELYRSYHMTDADPFYNKEDLWDIPQEVLQSQPELVLPYYVIMRLPGENKEEFVLIRPFTPANKPNAVAFFAGRADSPNYGRSSVYLFPKSKQVTGPRQIEARIDQTPAISQQFTLWNQQGSHVVRGNLLMIPIAGSYLYVEPIYLQAEQSQYPQLQRVVVVNGDSPPVMEPTLEESLNAVFAQSSPAPTASASQSGRAIGSPQPAARAAASATPAASPTPAPAATVSPGLPVPSATDVPGLAREAGAAYDRAQQRLREGDLAGYQRELEQVKAAVDRIAQISGTPRP